MGLLDGIRSALGLRAEADSTRDADPEDLFGMSTAHLTMEADLGYDSGETAALCFASVDSTDFRSAVEEVEEILEAGEVETGTRARFVDDSHGYDWVVLEDPDFEDLVTSVHFAADTLIERGYGSRLLAALFAFEQDGQTVYWVYSFRRGAYYPFAPTGSHDRDSGTEFKLDSVLDGELGVESDKEYWYPLWPDRPGGHPWQ
ncbi:hypothetical protein BRC68_18275 [Halobacteriales archaeon QH_6_64_20]|jgi:hypothetical protein|nr:MAG: hypothetical protein BRC68_18275 [Halobacteriales archaeon QH_6_64_20]